jgi:hypothetical protein
MEARGTQRMKNSDSKLEKEQESEQVNLELYRTAFQRLNFQDEYLFKFSTVFLTAQGALAILAGSAFFQVKPNYSALIIISAIGLFLAFAWILWTLHNDYWHSIWIGVLRDLEVNHLKTKARVFFETTKLGNRRYFKIRGHYIGLLIPVGIAATWGWALRIAFSL